MQVILSFLEFRPFKIAMSLLGAGDDWRQVTMLKVTKLISLTRLGLAKEDRAASSAVCIYSLLNLRRRLRNLVCHP